MDNKVKETKEMSFEPEENNGSEGKETVDKEETKNTKFPLSTRDIILGVVNLISIVLLVILLFKLPDRSNELNKLRIESLRNESNVSFDFGEVEANKGKAEKLENLFLDESGVVDFVDDVEKLKSQGTAVKKITFTSSEVIKDKTGNYGTPVVIEMSGTWEEIGEALQAIGALPYVLRPVNIVAKNSDEESVVSFTYGGFLYVNSALGQN